MLCRLGIKYWSGPHLCVSASGLHLERPASFFVGVRIRLGIILGRFSIIYFRGLGLRIRVWVRVRVWVRIGVRVSVVLWYW